MSILQFKQVTAVDAARRFSQVNDAATIEPVVLTENGVPRTVLLSVETFERFLANERSVFLAKDTPEEFLTQLYAIAEGDFARAGIPVGPDQRAE